MSHAIGIVGGGRMGSGIAHAFLTAGNTVTLVDVDERGTAKGLEEITRLVRASEKRGTLAGPASEVLARLRTTTDIHGLADSALVVEAVPEIIALKTNVLGRISASVAESAIIATNTSSLSIDSLAPAVSVPGRFIGMHFFNPVPASSLVELVRGTETLEATVDTAESAVEGIGKQPIVVSDSPGFASSRLGLVLGLEAIRMVESGVASAADIDTAMTLGYKHPVGPLRLTDIVGLDVRLDIATYLHEQLGPAFEPPQLLLDKVARGELGRKSGRGFFEWDG